MVVYIVVIEVIKKVLIFLGQKKLYIIEIIYQRAGVERADGAVDSKQPDIKGNERKLYYTKQ